MKIKILIILFCIFTGEIAGIDPPVKGYVPTFLSCFPVHHLNGTIMKRIEYQRGDQVGSCIYLKEAAPYISPSGKRARKATFQCECGNLFEAMIVHIKMGNTTSCGCYHLDRISKVKTKHRLCRHPIYYKWAGMIERCYNPKQKEYKNYGGRGIIVCNKWRNDFKEYYDYVISLENAMEPGLSIDRKDNDGNYEPGNLRWVTWCVQSVNQRMKSTNTSGYTGVSWHKKTKKYMGFITANGHRKCLGYFLIKEEALKARNRYIIDNNLPHKIQEYRG